MSGQCPKSLKVAIREVAGRIKKNDNVLHSEADTRAVLIEPMLEALGWNTADNKEVRREYRNPARTGGTLDYVLFVHGVPCVLIEAKTLGDIEAAEPQIRDYCEGSLFVGVATDGRTWSVLKGSLQPRISIGDKKACEKLASQISKDSVQQYQIGQIKAEVEGKLRKRFGQKPNARKYVEEARDNISRVHAAVQKFNKYVVANRGRFENRDRFRDMIRTYLNILQYKDGEKTTLKGIMKESFPELGARRINDIARLSVPGRYWGIARTLLGEYDLTDRRKFLDMVEAFYIRSSEPDELYEKLEAFTDGRRNFGSAVLTGLAMALRPEEFMVYNRRSADMLADICAYRELASVDMDQYREFNDFYTNVSKITGKSLVDLDIAADIRYERI